VARTLSFNVFVVAKAGMAALSALSASVLSAGSESPVWTVVELRRQLGSDACKCSASSRTCGCTVRLAAGAHFTLGGVPISAGDGTSAHLIGEGEGATLDAGGASRVVEVRVGGRLHLERVRLIHGRAPAVGQQRHRQGGCVGVAADVSWQRVERDGRVANQPQRRALLELEHVVISGCVALSNEGDECALGGGVV
jgi:hypothetical protein